MIQDLIPSAHTHLNNTEADQAINEVPETSGLRNFTSTDQGKSINQLFYERRYSFGMKLVIVGLMRNVATGLTNCLPTAVKYFTTMRVHQVKLTGMIYMVMTSR